MKLDISGQRFGSLVAIKPAGKDHRGNTVWSCECDCGNIASATVGKLRSGEKTSCGCGMNRTDARNKTLSTVEHFESSLKHSYANNASGTRGVSWNKQFRKWEASITFRGKRSHLGRFEDLEDAVSARKKAEQDLLKSK